MLKTINKTKPLNLVVVTGPTASGKTGFAAHLAAKLNGEIISADSRQVYRGMDLGTGKDYDDYTVDKLHIPYHLIDIEDPGNPYNVYAFQQDFIDAFQDIGSRKKLAILCGGTGLYIEAVLKGYKLIEVPPNPKLRDSLINKSDSELIEELKTHQNLHNKSDTDNRKRLVRALEIARYYQENPLEEDSYPEINYKIIGIRYDRSVERERITSRLLQRLDGGMIEEVKKLVDLHGPEKIEYFGLEYKFISWYIIGKISYEEMVTKLNTAIHQFAKRQMTWFRRMERHGFEIQWLEGHLPIDRKLELAVTYLNA